MGGSSSKEEEEGSQKKELEKEKDHPDNKKLEGNADFKGPADPSNRRTTDCLCVILICAMWFSLTVLGFTVCGIIPSDDLPAGNPAKLTHMMDYDGGICSVTEGVEDKPYGYILPSGGIVCVEKCPSENDFESFICEYAVQDELDDLYNTQASTGSEAAAKTAMLVLAATRVSSFACLWKMPTVVGPMYTCILDVAAEENAAVVGAAQAAVANAVPNNASMGEVDQSAFDDFNSDMMSTWHLVLIFGFVVAAIVGFISLRLLRLPFLLEFIIWGCIGGVFAFLGGIGAMLWNTQAQWALEDPPVHSSADIAGVKGMAYFFLVLCGVWTCVICCLRKRIMLAIGMTKEAAKALGSMTALILFPVFQTTGILAFSAVWFVYMVYLASSGDIVKRTKLIETCYPSPTGCDYGEPSFNVTYTEYAYSENTQKAYWYFLFCWFWTSEFIMAMGQIVTAMSVALWYFSRDKSSIGSGTVVTAIKTSFRYHLGTAAFGSLIIAIIKTIRAFIAYLQKNADKLAARGGAAAAALAKIILCCLQCCMWCIEKCAKFLNKHAYIQTAIFSYSFCTAARKAFFLILRNILLIGAVAIVSEFVLTLLIVLIPMCTTFLAYCFFMSMTELNSVFGPTMFTFFISYFTAKKFTETFGMVITTILSCYVADVEMFEPEQRFAGGSLKSAVSSGNEAARKKPKVGKVAPEPAKAEPAAEPVAE